MSDHMYTMLLLLPWGVQLVLIPGVILAVLWATKPD